MSRTSAVETSIQAVSAGTMVGGGAASCSASSKGRGVTTLLPGRGVDVTLSRVVVQEELVWMRPQVDWRDILRALHGDPGLQHIGRKHVALEQEVLVLLQG